MSSIITNKIFIIFYLLFQLITANQDKLICFEDIQNLYYTNRDINAKKVIIVLLNNQKCTGCELSTADFLNNLEIDTNKIKIITIARIGGSARFRRPHLNHVNKIFKKLSGTYFEIQTGIDSIGSFVPQDGIFGEYRIQYTPSLLCIDNSSNSINVITYTELFEGENLSKRGMNKIKKFSKE